MSGVVLVTGVSRDVAARCARALSATRDVVGLDVTAPRHDLGRGTFVRADVRSPALVETIRRLRPAVVVHAPSIGNPDDPGRRPVGAKELAVMGTLNVLSAVEQAEVRQLVLLSSVAVYPSSPGQATYLSESTPLASRPTGGTRRDLIEVEAAVAGVARRRPEMSVAVLRLAPLMGSGVDTAWTRYLSRRAVFSVAGFDGRVQFLHPADAVSAVESVLAAASAGEFNVAAPDVLSMSQVRRLAGRPGIPVPRRVAVSTAHRLRRPLPGQDADEVAFGRVVDPSRLMRDLGWRPRTSSRRAVEEFAAFARPGLWSTDRLDGVIAGLNRLGERL